MRTSPLPSKDVLLIVLMLVPETSAACNPVTTPVIPFTLVTGPLEMDAALAAAAIALASASVAFVVAIPACVVAIPAWVVAIPACVVAVLALVDALLACVVAVLALLAALLACVVASDTCAVASDTCAAPLLVASPACVVAIPACVVAVLALLDALDAFVTHSPATVFVSLTNVASAPRSASPRSENVVGSLRSGAVGSVVIVVIKSPLFQLIHLNSRNTRR